MRLDYPYRIEQRRLFGVYAAYGRPFKFVTEDIDNLKSVDLYIFCKARSCSVATDMEDLV